jgi:hypothetical protein
MPPVSPFGSKRGRAIAGLILLGAAACAMPGPAAPPPPLAPTQSRIWFYRQFSPAEPATSATVRVGGSEIGTAVPGHRFYRDFAPGTYHLSVDSYGRAENQDRDVTLAAGQELFVKIETLRNWISGFQYARDTFFVWPVSERVGRAEIAQTSD